MTKLAANLTLMFSNLPFLDRFDAAAAAGFKAVECLTPYEAPAEAVAERLERGGLKLVLFNMGVGDWGAGDRGLSANPDRVEEFKASLTQALHYARVTGCKQLHIAPPGRKPSSATPSWPRTPSRGMGST
jgi:hydroxypyruvate isomerase